MRKSTVVTYAHSALFYESPEELTAALADFVTAGIAADEHVMAVVDARRGELLRERLGTAEGFTLADSADVYTSPTRTLSTYIDMVRDGTVGGRRMRVAGEPIWAGRSPVELQQWSCVESASNAAFADSMLTMLCPYHVTALPPEIVSTARRTHPVVRDRHGASPSPEYVEPEQFHLAVRRSPLPPPPPGESTLVVLSSDAVAHACATVEAFASAQWIVTDRRADLVAAVDEVVSAARAESAADLSIRMWTDVHGLTCDIAGRWSVPAALPAFLRTAQESDGAPGMWMPGQRCDLIAIRELAGTTTVRLRLDPKMRGATEACSVVADLLGVHALGACDRDEAVAVETHVAGCQSCSEELAELALAATALELASHPRDPEPGCEDA